MRILITVFVLVVCNSLANDLPDFFPRCELDDSNFNDCIARAANTLRPYIRKGIKEIKFPSFDPLIVSTLTLKQESNLVNYTVTVWNYTIRGLDNYNLTEVRYDPKTMTFNGRIQYDCIYLDAKYNVSGHIIAIPIEGNGQAQLTFSRINGTYNINGEIIKRKGIEHYKPTDIKINMKIEDGSVNFQGLFNGNQELGRFTNERLNQNIQTALDAVTPAFEKQAEVGLMYLMKSLTRTIPYNKLFGNSPV